MGGEESQDKRRDPEYASISTPIVANSDNQTDGASQGGEPAGPFKRWLSKFNEPLTVVTLLLFGATVGLVWETRDLVIDAQHTAERQLRSYLYVDHGSFGPVRAEYPSGPRITIRSAGATPAYKLRLAATIEIGKFPLPRGSELSDPFNRGGEGITRKSYPILYGSDGAISEEINVKFSREATDLLKIDHHRLYVFGGVKYLDIFGIERRYDFCFSFNADPSSPIAAAQEDGCDNYNKPG
jgi:hypothetical protein